MRLMFHQLRHVCLPGQGNLGRACQVQLDKVPLGRLRAYIDMSSLSHTARTVSKQDTSNEEVKSLSLIVATTPSLGIGNKGQLPWPPLRADLAHFARITKTPPRQAPAGTINAVIMGRKTWDSIPEKLRPLKGRLNVVISQSMAQSSPPSSILSSSSGDAARVYRSVEEALVELSSPSSLSRLSDQGHFNEADDGSGGGADSGQMIGDIYVIGGASIYATCLTNKAIAHRVRKIYLTKVYKEYECDTFFPLDISGDGSGTFDGARYVGAGESAKTREAERVTGAEWESVPLDWETIGPLRSSSSSGGGNNEKGKDNSKLVTSGGGSGDGSGIGSASASASRARTTLVGIQEEYDIQFEFLLYQRRRSIAE